MKSEFLVWEYQDVPHACSLYELKGVERQYELVKGIPRASDFPRDAKYPMNPDFHHDTLLLDNLLNTDNLIVVSNRLKDFLAARPLIKVEYLPVTVLNHKKKPVGTDYFIVHPIELPECLDIDKSEAKWGIISKDLIDEVKQLVIDGSKVEPNREFFKPKPYYYVFVVRRILAEAIDAAGFTGIRWVEPENHPRPRK